MKILDEMHFLYLLATFILKDPLTLIIIDLHIMIVWF